MYKQSIAVIGAGISGIAAAYNLQRHNRVTLFEAQREIGGHANTVCVSENTTGRELNIDTGFIVLNNKNYPLFTDFLRALNVRTKPSDMSFSYTNEYRKQCYAGTRQGVFPELRKVADINHITMLYKILRYSKVLQTSLRDDLPKNISIYDYLTLKGCPQDIIQHYFIPIASAIWSCDIRNASDIPASAYITFFANHGLLDIIGKPQWYTINGGSREYLRRFEKVFNGRIIKNAPIREVLDLGDHVRVHSNCESDARFDQVVVATHADTAVRIVDRLPAHKSSILRSQKYTDNSVFLHTDITLMPKNHNLWASWNVIAYPDYANSNLTYTTYYMNRLQRINSRTSYLISVNPPVRPRGPHVLYETTYSHPILSKPWDMKERDSVRLNEGGRVYFCGSYLGYGFHEDGYKSGKTTAQILMDNNA